MVNVAEMPSDGGAQYQSLSLAADRATNALIRLDTDHDGHVGDVPGDQSEISADGQWFVLRSGATNLVPNDTNGVADIFERSLDPSS